MIFLELFKDPRVFGLCALLATIPTIVYMIFFLKKDPEPRSLVLKTFFFGCLSVLPITLMQAWFQQAPEYNVYELIKGSIPQGYLMWLVFYMFVGATEEYSKHLVVVVSDNDDNRFRRVVDGIELSIIAALGFAFVEHIIYFYQIYQQGGWQDVFVPFVFRSIFTTLAHCSFSGIYGYYYGKSHFMQSALHRESTVFRGLISAMVLHGIFNTLLEFNIVWAIAPLLMFELSFILKELSDEKNKQEHWGRDEA